MDNLNRHLLGPSFHELQHQHLCQCRRASHQGLQNFRSSGQDEVDDIHDDVCFWLEAVGSME